MSQESPPNTPPDSSDGQFVTAAATLRALAAEKSEDDGSWMREQSVNISPDARREIALNFLAAMNDNEIRELIREAQGNGDGQLAAAIKAAEAAGDWRQAISLKARQLRNL